MPKQRTSKQLKQTLKSIEKSRKVNTNRLFDRATGKEVAQLDVMTHGDTQSVIDKASKQLNRSKRSSSKPRVKAIKKVIERGIGKGSKIGKNIKQAIMRNADLLNRKSKIKSFIKPSGVGGGQNFPRKSKKDIP